MGGKDLLPEWWGLFKVNHAFLSSTLGPVGLEGAGFLRAPTWERGV